MNLFVDYVQPLTDWLQTNPSWALFITFLISLTESLAIIGSIVPGSVTMTAIGILAGSGIMRVDLTLIAATLGAVCGDGLSYALGFVYSDRLAYMWPLNKYPSWLKYGKDFFSRHGGKSVFLGRFVGPLRSIIPVIAGMMHMTHWRFFIANFLSAIGWSVLYIMPGVIIGAASHELSAESATRFFVLILILLAGIWLIGLLIKWLLVKLNNYFRKNLHSFWLNLKNHPILFKLFNAITPTDEINHYPTVSFLLTTALSIICFFILLILSSHPQWITHFDTPIHLFIQSFHTEGLVAFFIFCTQLTSKLTVSVLLITFCILLIHQRNFRTVFFLISVVATSSLIAFVLSSITNTPRPAGLLVTMSGSSFLAINIEIATAFYGFIALFINSQYSLLTNTIRTFTLVVLALSGVGTIYLGDYWLTDVIAAFFCGITVALIHYIVYRKSINQTEKSNHYILMLCTVLGVILCTSIISTYINYKVLVHNHIPYHKEFILSEKQWWDQRHPILPIYRLNRIGKPISLMNIQYLGDLDNLQSNLEGMGWVIHNETLLTNLLLRINSKSNDIKMPLLAQLFENKRPELIMTYKDKNSTIILEMRIWESNYHLGSLNRPIWIGSAHPNKIIPQNKSKGQISSSQLIDPLTYILPALNHHAIRRIQLPTDSIKKSYLPTAPYILLIKYQ